MFGYFSLIWGGFLVITYLALSYSAIWRQEFLPVFPESGPRLAPIDNFTNGTLEGPRKVRDPISLLLSPQSLAILFTGIFLLANGYFLLWNTQQKEKSDTKKMVIASMLTPEEKTVYEVLQKSKGQATQKQLSMQTGYSAVKTYRTIKRLEAKQIVKTFPFGMTKKIMLNEK